MIDPEQKFVVESAAQYANNELKNMPSRFKTAYIRNAIYRAYIEGAKTRKKR